MDLFRVQGRWGPSVRLAWIRVILKTSLDVCGGSQLSKLAPNTFPAPDYFELWATTIDNIFKAHVNNIIKTIKSDVVEKNIPKKKEKYNNNNSNKSQYQYKIDIAGEKQFLKCLLQTFGEETEVEEGLNENVGKSMDGEIHLPTLFSLDNLEEGGDQINQNSDINYNTRKTKNMSTSTARKLLRQQLKISDWSDTLLLSVLHTALRGFFLGDLYTAMTEFLSRAEGSFGLQVNLESVIMSQYWNNWLYLFLESNSLKF